MAGRVRMAVVMALLAVLGLAPFGPARAQGGGIILVPLDSGAGVMEPADYDRLIGERFPPDRTRGNHVDSAAAAGEPISPLRPVEARGRPAGSAIRFDGESRDLEFALFVPDPTMVRNLRISTLSSINVLPERSQYRVYVNGEYVGGARLEHFTQFGSADFDLPAGLLRRGQNRVDIRLSQYHRIFCGPEASFALWSDIDLASSGAVLDGPASEAGPESFMMGIALAAALGSPVEIRGTEGLGEHREAWIRQITQRITGTLGGDAIPFRFTEYWSVRGDRPPGARITFLPGSESRIGFRTGGDGAQVMIVEYRPGQTPGNLPWFDGLLPQLEPRRQPPVVMPERPVPFAEFGFRPVEVRDRYMMIEQEFRLPDDFVVLTNAKAEIRLDYIYAEGLPRGSMLLVHINGTNVRLLPLRGEGGRLIEQFPVRFEARLLRAGANVLGFEVMIPGDPADLPCPTWDRPVLAIGAESTLLAPYSPSLYLADMHFALNSLVGASIVTNEMTPRAYSDNDVVTMRAALGGNSAARGLQVRMHLLAIDDLASVPMGGYSFSRQAIERALLGAVDEPVLPETGRGLLQTVGGRDTPAALSGGWDWATRMFSAALQWMHPRAGVLLEEWLSRQRGQAVLLQLDPMRPDQLWLLRAPGADITAIASAFIAARHSGHGPRGQVAVLDHEGQWHSWVAPDRQPVLLEPIRLGNIRHVLGNFVSAMPIRYVTGLFFLALLSAVVALRLVIATREHHE